MIHRPHIFGAIGACPRYKDDALSAPMLSNDGNRFVPTLVARSAIL